jgi:hypothetical protein
VSAKKVKSVNELVAGKVKEAMGRSANSANSTNSAYPQSPGAVWPRDSILDDFMRFAGEYSESENAILIGSVLPIVARLLSRNVFIRFSGNKYPNVYNMLVTPPGFRKSTSIKLVERLARALLPYDALLEGVSSEQALFKLYQRNPDRLLIEDEGNTLLSNWGSDAAGKLVAKRFLRLYDCGSWTQTYIRQAEEDGDVLQRVDATSTSVLIGTTFNNCRFNGLETRDGMRRRVNYYVSETFAKTIYWPVDLDGERFAEIVELFKPLLDITGEFGRLSGEAMDIWCGLQDENRETIRNITGIDTASEAYGSALAEENAKILKFAMIFEICRWAKDRSRDWKQIQPDTIRLAAEHGKYCLSASQRLDEIGRRAEIREESESILAVIRTDFRSCRRDGCIELTKTQLTHRFAANPGRRGAMTPTRLYGEVIQDLQRRGLASLAFKNGKLSAYRFLLDEADLNTNQTKNKLKDASKQS